MSLGGFMTIDDLWSKKFTKENTSSAKSNPKLNFGRTCKNCRSHHFLAGGLTDEKIEANKARN